MSSPIADMFVHVSKVDHGGIMRGLVAMFDIRRREYKDKTVLRKLCDSPDRR